MKAAILKAPGDFQLEDLPQPKCLPGGVLVKVIISAVCGADVKMIDKGHKALNYPRILGHEITGEIIESDVDKFKKGDRVQIAPGVVCGECSFCRRGITNNCEEIDILGFTKDGGFAEYLAISAKGIKAGVVNLIPDNLSFSEAVFAEPLACCINGMELAQIKQGDDVLIIGAGPIGYLQVMLAKNYGANQIILADKLDTRLEFASFSEIDYVINTSKEPLEKAVNERTKGQGVDVIILACGQAAVDYSLVEVLDFRGRILLFSGLPKDNSRLEIDGNLLHYGEKTLVGAYGCTTKQNRGALKLMAEGRVKVDWLITEEISLNQIFSGIEKTRNKKGLKTIIKV
ncbi:alcohol dehydrogenase catalytic domain-containing protein [Natroniella acetigena]|uniref:alcohol dehydrogenase catalytic domain-containing protein n=1 Tax=Natroniella acetigena TaxID=52004 RepID=UPI00200ADB11|nr:alcohol dehydrogenase catalytic domain-containing protein [Natroniella acetigena]MCK8827151.1 alcohol dehydrogenase catalytic domain-containing protein [Natroniella acetigena]